jgi:hypothetical protein
VGSVFASSRALQSLLLFSASKSGEFARVMAVPLKRSRSVDDSKGIAGDSRSSVPPLPTKETLAGFGLEDSVAALTTGLASWSLVDLAMRRERAFEHAGGKVAERRQAKERASLVRRALGHTRANEAASGAACPSMADDEPAFKGAVSNGETFC